MTFAENNIKSALQGQQADDAFEGVSGQHQLQNDHDHPHLGVASRLCRVTHHYPACIAHPPHEKEKVEGETISHSKNYSFQYYEEECSDNRKLYFYTIIVRM